MVMASIVMQPNFELAAKEVQKFFALVAVGLAAAAPGLDTKKMRLHSGVAPGKKFHANFRAGFKDFALRRDERGAGMSFAVGFEEGEDIGVIEARAMRRNVPMEPRICPRSRALRKPTETLVAPATCARESLRRRRRRRRCKTLPGRSG